MTEQKPVFVKYIGRKLLKTDTVGRTNTVWAGHGDIQLVPRAVALQLVRHPKVWVPATAEEAARNDAAILGESSVDVLQATLTQASTQESAGLRANEEPDEPAPRDRRDVGAPSLTSETPVQSEPVPDEDDGPAPIQTATEEFQAAGEFEVGETMPDPEFVEGEGEQVEAEAEEGGTDLAKIIAAMPKDSAHFSDSTGVPLVKKVRELANDPSITHIHVKKAWEKLNG